MVNNFIKTDVTFSDFVVSSFETWRGKKIILAECAVCGTFSPVEEGKPLLPCKVCLVSMLDAIAKLGGQE